jgi:hypothetical protein
MDLHYCLHAYALLIAFDYSKMGIHSRLDDEVIFLWINQPLMLNIHE